jgi:hypothetical protein
MSRIFDANPGAMPRQAALIPAGFLTSLIILSAFANTGCSTGAPPTGSLARAEMSVRTAGEARASEFAPLDLQRAREKLEASKRAVAAKKYDEARRLAEGAQVEAELAEVKAEAEITRRAAAEPRRSIDALRVEAESRSTTPSSTAPAKE